MKMMLLSTLILLLLVACGIGGNQPASGGGESSSADGNASSGKQEVINLTISSFMPGQHPQHTLLFEPLIQEIEKVTEGRVTATLYPGSALGAADAQYDLVVTGAADMAMSLHSYTPGRFPMTSVSELPFLGKNAVDGTRILWQLYETFPEIFDNEHEGTKIGWLFKNDPAQILSAKKPIRSMEDLKGMKIRTPSPAASKVLEAYGAVPVSMSMNETYEAMQRGVVDAAMAPASVITNFQLADVTKHILRGNFYTSSLFVVIHPDTWNKISPEDQQAIEQLIGKEMAMKAAEIYDMDGDLGWEAARQAGIDIYELSDEEVREWRKPLEHIAEQWIEEMEQKGLPGRQIYEEAIKIRDQGE
jgi:TRAP-type C4-dicarboxylate transport system substrate-binding protein